MDHKFYPECHNEKQSLQISIKKLKRKLGKKIATIWFKYFLDKISIFIKIMSSITHKNSKNMYSQIKKSKNLKPKIANQKKKCKNQAAKNLHKNYGKIKNIKW